MLNCPLCNCTLHTLHIIYALLFNLVTEFSQWPISHSSPHYQFSHYIGQETLAESFPFFFFFFFWLLFKGLIHSIWRFPGWGSNQSYSCKPRPQLQQHGIQPMTVNCTTAHWNASTLTHWARPELKPASSWVLVGFVNHWARKGTPYWVFKSYAVAWLVPPEATKNMLLNGHWPMLTPFRCLLKNHCFQSNWETWVDTTLQAFNST